ncbi:MAG: hypothetical protein Q8T09_11385 [Candidatus Melainabacteria bacterium]|nr:hypothetical protein [Candidatus Melainabacteria bacterium]
MISQHFIDPSPMGWLRFSPDLRYICIGGPAEKFRLYREAGNLLMRVALTPEPKGADVAFKTVDGVCVGLALLTYDLNPRVIFVDLTQNNLTSLNYSAVQIAGASTIAYTNDGDKLLVGLANGVILEYAEPLLEDGSNYARTFQLPSEAPVLKILPAEENGVFLAYNDYGQLFCITPSETFEIFDVDGGPLNLKLVKHHATMPFLAAVLQDGALFIRDLLNGMALKLALVDSTKEVISLSFTPQGGIVVATEDEVVQISLFVERSATGEEQIHFESTFLYAMSSTKPIVAAEVAELDGAQSMLVLHN